MERICILAFLGINSWKDIRTREVSLLSIGVFGIVGISPVVIYEDQGFDQMAKDVVSYMEARYPGYNGSFKVYTRRAKKSYPITSMEVSAAIGEKKRVVIGVRIVTGIEMGDDNGTVTADVDIFHALHAHGVPQIILPRGEEKDGVFFVRVEQRLQRRRTGGAPVGNNTGIRNIKGLHHAFSFV